MTQEIQNEEWKLLSEKAWEVREKAHLYGDIKVGASLLSENGEIYSGCNIEHNIRSHDIHAEVNAICGLITGGGKSIRKMIGFHLIFFDLEPVAYWEISNGN